MARAGPVLAVLSETPRMLTTPAELIAQGPGTPPGRHHGFRDLCQAEAWGVAGAQEAGIR